MKNLSKQLAQSEASSLYYYHLQKIGKKQGRADKIKRDLTDKTKNSGKKNS